MTFHKSNSRWLTSLAYARLYLTTLTSQERMSRSRMTRTDFVNKCGLPSMVLGFRLLGSTGIRANTRVTSAMLKDKRG